MSDVHVEVPVGPPRQDGRAANALRPVRLSPNWIRNPLGSVLAQQGDTWVLATVSLTDGVPNWLRGRGGGWLTASYSLLPGSTGQRSERERRGAGGRTQEIERLVGRSLRAVVDLRGLVDCTLNVDCDVLQADGGTRTVAITAAWLALALAVGRLPERYLRGQPVLTGQVAAVSVGLVDGTALLDLDYPEDVRADTDMNVAMTAQGRFVEVQATAERAAFGPDELDALVALARDGIGQLLTAQTEVLRGIRS